MVLVVKNLPANTGDTGVGDLIPGSGRACVKVSEPVTGLTGHLAIHGAGFISFCVRHPSPSILGKIMHSPYVALDSGQFSF